MDTSWLELTASLLIPHRSSLIRACCCYCASILSGCVAVHSMSCCLLLAVVTACIQAPVRLSVYESITHTHIRLTALCPGLSGWAAHSFNGPFPGLPRWAGTRKVKPIWILLEQETVSGSGIHWAICKSAPHTRQTTIPAPHRSVFYRPDALPATQPNSVKALKAINRSISKYLEWPKWCNHCKDCLSVCPSMGHSSKPTAHSSVACGERMRIMPWCQHT